MSAILPHMVWPQCKFRMQVWNVLHAARWKYRTQKLIKNCHLGTIAQLCWAISLQLKKKLVKQQYLLHMSPQYGELWHTSGWDCFVSLGHPCKFQRVSRLCSITARHSSIGRQPNFAALNKGLYSARQPSRRHQPTFLVLFHFMMESCVNIHTHSQSQLHTHNQCTGFVAMTTAPSVLAIGAHYNIAAKVKCQWVLACTRPMPG